MPTPPPIESQLQPAVSSQPPSSSHPAMENHETECYVLQSLELLADLATTPINQYCGPEHDRCAEAWAPPTTSGSFEDGVVTPRCKFFLGLLMLVFSYEKGFPFRKTLFGPYNPSQLHNCRPKQFESVCAATS